MLTKKAKVSALIVSPIIFALVVMIYIISQLYSSYSGEDTEFRINPGEGFSRVNHNLNTSGIVTNPRIFHYYTKFSNKMNSLKTGTYKIPSGSNMMDVLYILTEGTPILAKVTIPEGKNMFEIGKILESANITSYDSFVKACRDSKNIKLIGEDAPSVEGYLFPETYLFSPGTPANEIIRAMITQFKRQVKMLEMDSTFLTPHEVVVLASIVEKETGAKHERKTIAGVYTNRLHKKMRLQADPTTIYGIWESYDGNLKKEHLFQKTDYNTYKMAGLPLGPIANPSLAAIKAVIAPEEHDFVYFVSKNDGTHVFTSTYKEHLKAVDFWQKNRANREGKSWRDLKQN